MRRPWVVVAAISVALSGAGCSPVIGLIARVASRGPSETVLPLDTPVEGTTREGTDIWQPSCGAPDGGGEQVFTLRVPEAGRYQLDVEARYDAVLAVFGPDERSLGCNDDDGRTTRSALTLSLEAGTAYTVVVDGYRGATGDFTLRARRVVPVPPDAVGQALPLHRGQPGSTAERGDGFTLPCGAEPGSPDQLWTLTPPETGRYTVTIRGAQDMVLAVLPPAGEGDSPLACNDDFHGSRVARVELELTGGRAYRVVVDGKEPQGARYRILAGRAARRTAVRGVMRLETSAEGHTGRGLDRHTFGCGVTPGSPDEAWLYRADGDGDVRFQLSAEYDAALAVFEEGSSTPLGCVSGADLDAGLTVVLRRGQVYRAVVDGREGATGAYSLLLSRVPHTPDAVGGPQCSHAPRLRPGLSAERLRPEWAQRTARCGRTEGPEALYRVSVTRPSRVRVAASSVVPLTLSLQRGCASPADEVACAAPERDGTVLEVDLEPGQDYLLVVDSPRGSEGTFTLDVVSEFRGAP